MCLSSDRQQPVQEGFVTYIEVGKNDKQKKRSNIHSGRKGERGRVREWKNRESHKR